MNNSKNGSEDQSNNIETTIPKRNLIELFSLIHGEGLWALMSKECQDYGAHLYFEETGQELSIAPGGMKYSIGQHMTVVDRILPAGYKTTDFWKIVTSITWIMMAIEKNPLLAEEIKTSDDPTALITTLEARGSRD